jgi:hypothetical protein
VKGQDNKEGKSPPSKPEDGAPENPKTKAWATRRQIRGADSDVATCPSGLFVDAPPQEHFRVEESLEEVGVKAGTVRCDGILDSLKHAGADAVI